MQSRGTFLLERDAGSRLCVASPGGAAPRSGHAINYLISADRPTLPGGRGIPGGGFGLRGPGAGVICRGAGCGEPKPKKSRNDGVACAGCYGATGGFFGASLGGAIAAAAPGVPDALGLLPSGVVAAIGVSPLACSRPTSRRGQA